MLSQDDEPQERVKFRVTQVGLRAGATISGRGRHTGHDGSAFTQAGVDSLSSSVPDLDRTLWSLALRTAAARAGDRLGKAKSASDD